MRKPKPLLIALSSIIIPGLGQIINGQKTKGIFLIMGFNIFFLSLLAYVIYKFHKAASVLGSIPASSNKWLLLKEQLASHSFIFLYVFAAIYLCFLVFSVVDAYRNAQKTEI